MGRYWYDVFQTEWGWVGVLGSAAGLRRSTLPQPTPMEALEELGREAEGAVNRPDAFPELRERLQAYLRGESQTLDVALDLEGAPPFHKAAWRACRRIPPGETRSYAWLAAAASHPGAARAAGQAMARNRLALIVPCHRVVASDGSLHGYDGGLAMKERLLQAEAAGRAERSYSLPLDSNGVTP